MHGSQKKHIELKLLLCEEVWDSFLHWSVAVHSAVHKCVYVETSFVSDAVQRKTHDTWKSKLFHKLESNSSFAFTFFLVIVETFLKQTGLLDISWWVLDVCEFLYFDKIWEFWQQD